MIENPSSRVGLIAEKRAELHFISKGYGVSWPSVDHGFDLLIDKNDRVFLRMQVKNLGPYGTVPLNGAHRHMGRSRDSRRAAASQPRHYDYLVIVSDEYVWVIPEAETRGIVSVGFRWKGRWHAKSKWDKFREERLDGRREAKEIDVDQGGEGGGSEGLDSSSREVDEPDDPDADTKS